MHASTLDVPDLLAAMRPDLRCWASRRVGTDEADDLTSDIVATAWSRRASYDPTVASFEAWVWGIAKFEMYSFLRKRQRPVVREGMGEALDTPAADEPALNRIAAGRALAATVTALAALRDIDRQTILDATSNALACTLASKSLTSADRVRLHRARNRLRKSISDDLP